MLLLCFLLGLNFRHLLQLLLCKASFVGFLPNSSHFPTHLPVFLGINVQIPLFIKYMFLSLLLGKARLQQVVPEVVLVDSCQDSILDFNC